MTGIDRRKFVGWMMAGATTPYVLLTSRKAQGQGGRDYGRADRIASHRRASVALDLADETTFDLGIASGDPSASGVVLWTRIAPRRFVPGQDLFFDVAADAAFQDRVLEGVISATDIGPANDFTVKVDLEGQLQPARRYFYRFRYASSVSPVGRCKTVAEATTATRSIKLAMLSCQDYTNGYYGALGVLAEDTSVDFVVHLGDFIYESVADPRFQSVPFEDRVITLPSGATVVQDLNDYRHLYRTYRSDVNLRRAMASHTWIITTDDHETANDCYWDYERDTLGAPDHPFTAQGNDPNVLRQLKLDSQKAWLEYVPARVTVDASATHPHGYSRIYRRVRMGNLLELFMLDTRTYRSAHPCGEGGLGERYLPLGCTPPPAQTLLGAEQRAWLLEGLQNSTAQWKVLGNQTFLGQLAVTFLGRPLAPINVDAWDGYTEERDLLLNEVRRREVNNLVVLTGDLHTTIASHVKRDYTDLRGWNVGNLVGVEFMSPSVTSAGLVDLLENQVGGALPSELAASLSASAVKLNNPHIRNFEGRSHGYCTVTFEEGQCDWRAFAVNKNSPSGSAPQEIAARRKYTFWPWLVRP